MSVRERLAEDLKTSMKAGDKVRTSTLRLIQCAIKDRDIAARAADKTCGCEDQEIMGILAKMVKQREESVATYEDAGRLDLSENERAEMEVILEYLPKQMTMEEIRDAASKVVDDLEASGLKDMGKCMAALKERFQGRMDFSAAGQEVKQLLAS